MTGGLLGSEDVKPKQLEFNEQFFIPPRLKKAQKMREHVTATNITHLKLSRKAFVIAPLSTTNSNYSTTNLLSSS